MDEKVTIIAVGDPHFRIDNIPEVEEFMKNMKILCNEIKPDCIVILGDVLHTHERLHTSALNKAEEFIDDMRKIAFTIVLVGNHDMISNQEFLTTNHWMNSMKKWNNIQIVDKVFETEIKGRLFLFCPYVFPGRFEEALNTNKNWTKSVAIFAHQEFYGCKMGAIVSSVGDKWSSTSPSIISGHIHSNQTLNNVYYPGSSLQHAFGESDKNIIPVFTWKENSKTYELKEVDLQLSRKKIIYRSISDIDKIDIETLKKNNDKIKLSLNGNQEEFKAFKKTKKYKDMIKDGVKVVFKNKKKIFEEEEKKEDDNEPGKLEISENDFSDILKKLVFSEKNKDLFEVYEYVVNDNVVNGTDILFL